MSHMEEIINYYKRNNVEGYPDYYILGWESEEAQKSRFEELVGVIDLNGANILDVGCGTGNLLEYIGDRFSNYKYTGIDVLPHMIERAKQKGHNGQFYCLDMFKNNPFTTGEFDVIFSSGIFNLNLGNNEEFLEEALRLFTNLSRDVIAFNLLWDKSTDKDNKYFYFSPEEVFRRISAMFGKEWHITVLKGYLNNDFTVHLSRNCKKKYKPK